MNEKQTKTGDCEEKDAESLKERTDGTSEQGSYYYDDAHGYEVFDAATEEENDEN